MARAADVPKFGPLAGVRIVNATKSTAGGFANSILAEMGADVIWVESPQSTDPTRGGPGEPAQYERRNMRNICFNIPNSDGRKILFDYEERDPIDYNGKAQELSDAGEENG